MPACLKGQQNGKVNPSLLVECGVGSATMVVPAARAMRAMMAAARKAGFDPRHVGAYRSYDSQVALFTDRYSKTEIKGRPTKTWNGVKYWQKPGTAMAAVPGTSNHGWGLALDIAEERNGKPGADSISSAFVEWLIKNAATYGFSAEAQSEPWHWRYVAGDAIPAAVLAYEGSTQPTAPTAPVLPTPAPKPEGKTHTVAPGETYWQLAKRYLGSGARWQELAKANGSRPLHPGDVIRIPEA